MPIIYCCGCVFVIWPIWIDEINAFKNTKGAVFPTLSISRKEKNTTDKLCFNLDIDIAILLKCNAPTLLSKVFFSANRHLEVLYRSGSPILYFYNSVGEHLEEGQWPKHSHSTSLAHRTKQRLFLAVPAAAAANVAAILKNLYTVRPSLDKRQS